MATTAAGTPYVEASDLVAGYPAVSLALANHIDTIGKVLQVVRVIVGSNTTTSTSLTDVSGASITITPTSATNIVMILAPSRWTTVTTPSAGIFNFGSLRITDTANTVIANADAEFGSQNYSKTHVAANYGYSTLVGWDAPGSIAAKTYKARFSSGETTSAFVVASMQLIAIEVAA